MVREKEGWLLCDQPRGARYCSGRIGSIDEMDLVAPNLQGTAGRRVLHLLPGWRRDQRGVYHETPNAFDRRKRRGYPPRPLPGTRSGMKRNRGPSFRAASFEPTSMGWAVKLRCPDCQHLHELTAGVLGVMPITPHSMYTETHKAE